MSSTAATAQTTKPKAVPTHPPVATMVNDAITALKDRKGTSLIAIKKHIAANNTADIDRLAGFIKRYLKSAVEAGKIVQTKGTGATGSFKMGKVEKPKKEKVEKKPADKKEKVEKKPAAKKEGAPKPAAKKPAAKKEKAVKNPTTKTAAKKTKSFEKTTSKKPATKKPKTPKKVTKPAAAKSVKK